MPELAAASRTPVEAASFHSRLMGGRVLLNTRGERETLAAVDNYGIY